MQSHAFILHCSVLNQLLWLFSGLFLSDYRGIGELVKSDGHSVKLQERQMALAETRLHKEPWLSARSLISLFGILIHQLDLLCCWRAKCGNR